MVSLLYMYQEASWMFLAILKGHCPQLLHGEFTRLYGYCEMAGREDHDIQFPTLVCITTCSAYMQCAAFVYIDMTVRQGWGGGTGTSNSCSTTIQILIGLRTVGRAI